MIDRVAIRAQVDEEIARLRDHAAASINPCMAAKVIALADERVVERVVDRLEARNVYRGTRCLGQQAVLIRFDGPPGQFWLNPPSFLVRVSLQQRVVTAIVDGYDTAEPPPVSLVAPTAPPALAAEASISVPLDFAADVGTREITVTVAGAIDVHFQIGATVLTFDAEGKARADVPSGKHNCRWAVRGDPGDSFTIKVEGASKPISFTAEIEDPEGEAGQFTINVA